MKRSAAICIRIDHKTATRNAELVWTSAFGGSEDCGRCGMVCIMCQRGLGAEHTDRSLGPIKYSAHI